MTRTKSRTDTNQSDIVAAFEACDGVKVHLTHREGKGFPDLVVGLCGLNLLVEVKDGNKPASARKLTKAQEKWHDEWPGQVTIVECAEEARGLVAWIQRDKW